MKKFLIPFILAAAALFSCSTEFDPNAEAKDIAVVFGLLDQNDSIHYIKITKAFLGEQDALVMATDPANSTYGDVLEVRVEEYANGTLIRTFDCERTEITNKDDGIFYYPNQELYMFTGDLNVNNLYRLVITHLETGKIITGETGLVSDFNIEKPFYNPANPQLAFVNTSGGYVEGEAKWKSAKNGRLYEPVFRFHYREVDTSVITKDTVDKYVDWKLISKKAALLNGGEIMLASYNADAWYRLLENVIPVNPNMYRIIGNVDFSISVGGDELSTYIDLNRPSTSIIQERPAFTNISNGIGLFSCRHTKSYSFKLSAFSIERLISGEFTYQLGFHYID